MRRVLRKYDGPPRWGTCWGDHRCRENITHIVEMYGREFPVCRKHKRAKVMSKDNEKNARAEWRDYLQKYKRGKIRYPRTRVARVFRGKEIVALAVSNIKKIDRRGFRHLFREWCEIQGFAITERKFKKFVDEVGMGIK